MDQQNPKHVPTEAEIARLEAEAVRALQRGETPSRHPGAHETALPEQPVPEAVEPAPEPPAFVPYVDDVPEPEPSENTAEDDDDEEYIPSKWEKRIDALTPEQWKRWQIIGGAAVGVLAVSALFVFGQELATYGLIVAVLLAMLLPRYLERAWRRKLTTARYAMIIAMVVTLAAAALIAGLRSGFSFTGPK